MSYQITLARMRMSRGNLNTVQKAYRPGRRKDANLRHSPSKNENFQKYALDTANAHTNLS